MPPPLTPQDEEEERRRLLESVDYAALDGLAGATSSVTGTSPPAAPREREVIRPFADDAPLTIGRSEPAAAPAPEPTPPVDRHIDPRSSTAPGRRGPWPDAPGSRRVGNTIAYAPGTLPMPARAQAVEERLREGGAEDVAEEMDAEARATPPPAPMEIPRSPLDTSAPPPAAAPAPEAADPEAEERAMAALAGADTSAQPPAELASLRPQAAALGSPVAPAMDEPAPDIDKPEAITKEGPQGLIPGDDELASARAGDVPRRLLHNLANAFRAMGGRPANREFVRDEDRVRAQQRQMLGDKRTARGDEQRSNEQAMTRALQQRQMEQREQQASERADIQRAQLDLAGRTADRQDQMSQAQMSRLLEQTESERADRTSAAAMRDPASDVSGRRRTVLEGLVSALPPGDRARVTEALGHSADGQSLDIDQLSAEDLDALRRDMTRFLGNGLRSARGGTRGGSTGGPPRAAPAGIVAAARAQVQPLVERGVLTAADGEALAADLGSSNPRVRAEAQRVVGALRPRGGRGGGGDEEGEEILPGVRAGMHLSAGESRHIRDGFASMRSQYGALGQIENVASRFGASATIDRNAAGEMAAPLTRLRAMVANLQNTGVINPSEAPAIEAMLPNPSSLAQMTFGDLQSRLGSFRGELERAVESQLVARGVDDSGLENARRMLRGMRSAPGGRARADARATPAAPAAAPAASGPRVAIVLPNGRRAMVPESQLEAALARGARRAE